MKKVHPALKDKVYFDENDILRWKDDDSKVDKHVILLYNSYNRIKKGD